MAKRRPDRHTAKKSQDKLKAVALAYDRLIAALAVLAGAAIAVAFLLIIFDVTVRTIGRAPPAVTSAAVEYILLYFTLLSAPYLVRQKSHVLIDALVTRMTGRVRWVVEKLAYLVCICTASVIAYIGFGLFMDAVQYGLIEERSVDVPLWIAYGPLAPIFSLIAVEFARLLIGRDSLYSDQTQASDSV